MPTQLFYPRDSVLAQAADAQARLAGSKLRLWKSGLNVSFSTARVELLASEADFDGYPAGGATLTAWGTPMLAPVQAALTAAPQTNFAAGAGVGNNGNVIGGFWVETAAGDLWIICQLPEAVPMQVPGQGLPITMAMVFPSGLG